VERERVVARGAEEREPNGEGAQPVAEAANPPAQERGRRPGLETFAPERGWRRPVLDHRVVGETFDGWDEAQDVDDDVGEHFGYFGSGSVEAAARPP
jgi:hypothetical protein